MPIVIAKHLKLIIKCHLTGGIFFRFLAPNRNFQSKIRPNSNVHSRILPKNHQHSLFLNYKIVLFWKNLLKRLLPRLPNMLQVL